MSELAERIELVHQKIAAAATAAGRKADEITLCAATKTQSDETIRRAIAAGITVCGENRAQELTAHLQSRAYDGAREVHFIGHLQTNKVKQVVGKVAVIESVDSEKLLQAVDKQAQALGIVQGILLQVNVAGELQKGGCTAHELPSLVALASQLGGIKLRGLMTIPPVATQERQNIPFFSQMNDFFIDIREKMKDNQSEFNYLSMGMSDDYEQAIAHGATLVRVGTALFGARAYT